MQWSLDQGDGLTELIQAAAAGSKAAQREIDDAPPLTIYESIYWQAFGDLRSERSVGMGSGPIPWSKIIDYASFNELTMMETDFLLRIIREMDNLDLNHHAEKAKKSTK